MSLPDNPSRQGRVVPLYSPLHVHIFSLSFSLSLFPFNFLRITSKMKSATFRWKNTPRRVFIARLADSNSHAGPRWNPAEWKREMEFRK